jgi:hypothetical protein
MKLVLNTAISWEIRTMTAPVGTPARKCERSANAATWGMEQVLKRECTSRGAPVNGKVQLNACSPVAVSSSMRTSP